jgi:outer membrane protein assembly factor BamB
VGVEAWTRQFGVDAIAKAVAIAPDGSVVVAGQVLGALLPGLPSYGGHDGFVAKLEPEDGDRLWVVQFGTPAWEDVHEVVVDERGHVYVVGETGGALGAEHLGGLDAFVLELDPAGVQVRVLQFGTAETDAALGVAFAADGDLVAVGVAGAALPGAASAGFGDAFAMKLTPSLAEVWTHQFGTMATDMAHGVALAPGGDLVVVGMAGAMLGDAYHGGPDAFVRRLGPDGAPLWTRQLGTGAFDRGFGVAVAPGGRIHVSGISFGNLVIGGVGAGEEDVFVVTLHANGATVWTTMIASPESDVVYTHRHLAVDAEGDLWVVGQTRGSVIPGGSQKGNGDAFVLKLDSEGETVWGRSLATEEFDIGMAVALDGDGFGYVVGATDGSLSRVDDDALGPDAFVRKVGP